MIRHGYEGKRVINENLSRYKELLFAEMRKTMGEGSFAGKLPVWFEICISHSDRVCCIC